MKTIAQTELVNPKEHTIKEKPVLSMIHKYNIAELALVDRPVRGPENGFGTVINKHETGHDRLWRNTSSAEAHGYGLKLSAFDEKQKYDKQERTQGGLREPRPFVEQGVKCISGLTGEVYKIDDPQESTDVQRSWLYTTDASLTAAQKIMQTGKVDQKLKEDNALSLPLGDGERAKYSFSDQPGFYRHKRQSDITVIRNNIITRK
jgi:hypothetical protein|tara:strand:+ start:445 stop:1059 length:615 start_codon:yes stop_codon:yes gene_type:complete